MCFNSCPFFGLCCRAFSVHGFSNRASERSNYSLASRSCWSNTCILCNLPPRWATLSCAAFRSSLLAAALSSTFFKAISTSRDVFSTTYLASSASFSSCTMHSVTARSALSWVQEAAASTIYCNMSSMPSAFNSAAMSAVATPPRTSPPRSRLLCGLPCVAASFLC